MRLGTSLLHVLWPSHIGTHTNYEHIVTIYTHIVYAQKGNFKKFLLTNDQLTYRWGSSFKKEEDLEGEMYKEGCPRCW